MKRDRFSLEYHGLSINDGLPAGPKTKRPSRMGLTPAWYQLADCSPSPLALIGTGCASRPMLRRSSRAPSCPSLWASTPAASSSRTLPVASLCMKSLGTHLCLCLSTNTSFRSAEFPQTWLYAKTILMALFPHCYSHYYCYSWHSCISLALMVFNLPSCTCCSSWMAAVVHTMR